MDPQLIQKFLERHPSPPLPFTIDDCQSLEKVVTERKRGKFQLLNSEQLHYLRSDLSVAAILYKSDCATQFVRTSQNNIKRLENLRHHSIMLLQNLGFDPHNPQNKDEMKLIMYQHWMPGGVFFYEKRGGTALVEGLMELSSVCNQLIKQEDGNPTKGCTPSTAVHLLVGRLGRVYKKYWGNGKLTLSVNSKGEGGPSVRFIQEAAKKILQRGIGARSVQHAWKMAEENWSDALSTYAIPPTNPLV